MGAVIFAFPAWFATLTTEELTTTTVLTTTTETTTTTLPETEPTTTDTDWTTPGTTSTTTDYTTTTETPSVEPSTTVFTTIDDYLIVDVVVPVESSEQLAVELQSYLATVVATLSQFLGIK